MNCRMLRWALVAVSAPIVFPAAASATTASVQGGVIVIEDTAGINDTIAITSAGSNAEGDTIGISGTTPGPGCTQGAGRSLCPDGTGSDGTGTPHSMQVTLAGGDDSVVLSYGINTGLDAPDATFDTGAGEDRVEVRPAGQFVITTGTEDDTVVVRGIGPAIEPATIDLGAGNDSVDLLGHPSDADTVDGGTGSADRASYAGRAAAVTVVSDPAQSSGQAGEGDRLSSFETLQGGNGTDTILGGPGRDTLIGGGGTGDVLRGFGGADTLNTNDGVADARADCGADFTFPRGNDVAIIDLPDPHPNFVSSGGFLRPVNGGLANCESVMEQPVGQKPVAVLTRARAVRRAVLVRARCTRPRGCRGILRVTNSRGRTISSARRFRLAPGRSRTFRIPLKVRSAPRRATVVARGRDARRRPLTSSTVVRPRGTRRAAHGTGM